MIGNQSILTDYKSVSNGQVTFGNGVQGRVLGKGTLNMKGFLRLESVLHVDGLKTNLISISQIYDLDLHVNLTRGKCSVVDNFGNCLLKGVRSVDNYYTLSQPYTCHNVSINNVDLWHDILGHLNSRPFLRLLVQVWFVDYQLLVRNPMMCVDHVNSISN